LIYLALPYTHHNEKVVEQRFEAACEAYALLTSTGYVVLCPVLMSHPVALKYELPGDWETWKEIDLAYLRKCDSMLILSLEGVQESVGVNAEIEAAYNLGLPIRVVTMEELRNG